ncbi:hypothetical protein AB4072_04640 [Microvirga sp. 2MCAF38]|uniref:DUF6968 family protein n=1 Tax=Microvirga sp. 2MCAF38 TaxID=3232989 RepID=UPI003F9A9517
MLIATRDLEYVTEDGAIILVPVCLYSPEKTEKDWGCRYTIGWPNGIEMKTVYGWDAIQALVLTLQGIGISLYCSDYHKTGRLKWDPSGGYGFPVPKNARDMRVGYDKEFDG